MIRIKNKSFFVFFQQIYKLYTKKELTDVHFALIV